MRGVETTVTDEVATVEILDEKVRGQVLDKLLEAAGEQPRQVRILTGGRSATYRVPLALARKAGVVDRAPAKKAPAKAADKPTDKNAEDTDSTGD